MMAGSRQVEVEEKGERDTSRRQRAQVFTGKRNDACFVMRVSARYAAAVECCARRSGSASACFAYEGSVCA